MAKPATLDDLLDIDGRARALADASVVRLQP